MPRVKKERSPSSSSHFEKFNTEAPPSTPSDDFESRIVPLEPGTSLDLGDNDDDDDDDDEEEYDEEEYDDEEDDDDDYDDILDYDELPEARDELDEEVETKANDVERQSGPGQVTANCRLNLAAQESAQITFRGRVVPKTLMEDYPNIAQFELPSQAEILLDESTRAVG